MSSTFWCRRRRGRWGISRRSLQTPPARCTDSGRTRSSLARCTSSRRPRSRATSLWSSYSCHPRSRRGICTPHSGILHDLERHGSSRRVREGSVKEGTSAMLSTNTLKLCKKCFVVKLKLFVGLAYFPLPWNKKHLIGLYNKHCQLMTFITNNQEKAKNSFCSR